MLPRIWNRTPELDILELDHLPVHTDAWGNARVIRVRQAQDAELIRSWTEGVRRARNRWRPAFSGEQFSLGMAWYAQYEEGTAESYFAQVERSDAEVEAALPGAQAWMRRVASEALGIEVGRRPGWCGAGVHIFPQGRDVSVNGGDIHFDSEGLEDRRLSQPAFSLVLMLDAPPIGGGLRVWDAWYRYEKDHDATGIVRNGIPDVPSVTVVTRAGDLTMFDCHRLHQIQPFSGGDRITLTLHTMRTHAGSWVSWF